MRRASILGNSDNEALISNPEALRESTGPLHDSQTAEHGITPNRNVHRGDCMTSACLRTSCLGCREPPRPLWLQDVHAGYMQGGSKLKAPAGGALHPKISQDPHTALIRAYP